jgi:hypothetical protein
MHNCRRIENQLVNLLFDEMDAAFKRRLLREIKSCASCHGHYQSLSETLFVFERAAAAALPPASYWPRYNATLRDRLRAPAPVAGEEKAAHASLWRRLLAARLPVPVPVAAALVMGLIISSALALRRAPQTQLALPQPPIESVRFVEVPVVRDRLVTRVVYVEKKRTGEREARAAAAARRSEVNDAAAVADSKPEEETGFFTRANLKGFQPADDMKFRVIKRNNPNDK